ncbi:MAG: C-GCAxxG-C-C family protein [Candidatus Merdivicinus sp.]|jgi:C_GCAxxG_C_C family probable redox protein
MSTEKRKAELAQQYFEQGYNCCQSVVLAFAPEMGISEQTATLLTAGMGGGVGRLREICGAISGSALVLGMMHGSTDPNDRDRKAALYAEIQRLAKDFAEQHGSYICRDLLGLPEGSDQPKPEARTPEYYAKRPCAKLIHDAAAILEQYLL